VNVSGSCHCGAITFDAVIKPEYVVICHCTDCQVMSSAPYRVSVPVRAENLHLSGTPSTYIKTGDSGNQRKLAFCGGCGSALYSTTLDERPALYNLRWGIIRERSELIPKRQGFCGSRAPWTLSLADVAEVRPAPPAAR